MRPFRATAVVAAVTSSVLVFSGIAIGMTIDEKSIVGTWRKSTQSVCARKYPSEITLGASGVYRAPTGVSEGAIWHGGDWALLDGQTISLQLANDRMEQYRIVSIAAEHLTVLDLDDCEVTFARS